MLAYCVHCQSLKVPEHLSEHDTDITCGKCAHVVLVLDGDRAQLSDQVQKPYAFDDASEFSGRSTIFSSEPSNVQLLECEDALRMDENNFDAALYLAKYAYSHFRYIESEHRLRDLTRRHSSELEPRQLLANIYLILKKYDLALAACEDIRKTAPHDSQSFFNLGLACYYSSRFFRASIVFKKLIEKDSHLSKKVDLYLDDCLRRLKKLR